MSKGNGKFALGAIIGAAAGVIAGFLTAPQSGKETRDDIKHKADDLKDKAAVQADKVSKQVSKSASEAKKGAADLKSRAERALGSAKKEFKKEVKKESEK